MNHLDELDKEENRRLNVKSCDICTKGGGRRNFGRHHHPQPWKKSSQSVGDAVMFQTNISQAKILPGEFPVELPVYSGRPPLEDKIPTEPNPKTRRVLARQKHCRKK